MGNFTPNRPTGSTPEALFDQSLWDKAHGAAGKLNSSSTVKVSRTTKGYFFRAKGGTGGASPKGVGKFTYVSMAEDYIACTNDKGGVFTLIAKQPEIRNSITTLTLDETVYNYTYTAFDKRTVNFGSGPVFERISPRYYPGCKIWADQPEGGTGVTVDGKELKWMDTNRGARAWAEKFDQTGP